MSEKKQLPVENGNYQKVELIAKLFDISVRRVQQLTQDGVLQTTAVKNEAGRTVKRYELGSTVQRYVKYLSDKAYGRNEKTENLEESKLEKEIKIKDARAQRLEIELSELKGEMHRSEDVEAVTNELVYTVRSALLALPGRLAVDTCNAETPSEASDIIRDEVHVILSQLAEHEYDPEVYKRYVREREGWNMDLLEDENGD